MQPRASQSLEWHFLRWGCWCKMHVWKNVIKKEGRECMGIVKKQGCFQREDR